MYHLALPIAALYAYNKYIDRIKNINLSKNTIFVMASLHNACISAFSLYIFIKTSAIVYNNGIVFQHEYYFGIEEFDKLALLFYLSKYYKNRKIYLW